MMSYLLTLRAMSKDRLVIEEANVEARFDCKPTYADTLTIKAQFCERASVLYKQEFHPDNCVIVFMFQL